MCNAVVVSFYFSQFHFCLSGIERDKSTEHCMIHAVCRCFASPCAPCLFGREESRIAREFVARCVAFDVAEEEERMGEEPQCSIHEASNHTLRRLGSSVDRCEYAVYI